MDISQEQKAALLEQAAINASAEEISDIYGKLGHVEMSAPALGLACRYRGLEAVKALVGKGASFDFPLTEETEKKYRCYIGKKYENYRTNYSLYLLKVFRGEMKGACCAKGMSFLKYAARKEGKPLPFLPDGERIRVLDFLWENREKTGFDPSEMLYYAVFSGDDVIASRLKSFGVKISDVRVNKITDGGLAADGYWYEYCAMTGKLADKDYLSVMKQLAAELDGKPFHLTDKIYELTKKRFYDIDIFKFFFSCFKQDKMNKTKIIRDLISTGNAEALPIVEKAGWLNMPGKRDEFIKFASDAGSAETLAWLLDYKNRTADFAAEREKAEKKLRAELNAAPDSVTALKKIWSFKKREDGTLIITNYKGTDKTTVTVPEKIGKSTVTAIGNGAFATASGAGAGSVNIRANYEQIQARRKITGIILPKTLKYIGTGAFTFMRALKDIDIPEGVEEIGAFAFYECDSITEITVPGTVKKIGGYAFSRCGNLRRVKICEGVVEIGAGAFHYDSGLEEVELPGSVRRLLTETTRYSSFEVFDGYSGVTVRCPEGSFAESYCKQHNIKCVNESGDI